MCLHVLSSFQRTGFLPRSPSDSSVVRRTLQSYVTAFALSTPTAFWRRDTVPVGRVFDGAETTWGVASFEGVTAAFATGKVTLGINQYTRRVRHCQPRPFRRRRPAFPDARSSSIGPRFRACKRGCLRKRSISAKPGRFAAPRAPLLGREPVNHEEAVVQPGV
jgi:hypothetical protein